MEDKRTIHSLHFADDQKVLAQRREDLEFLARKLTDEHKC